MLKRQHRPKRCPTVLGTPTIIAQLLFTVVPPPCGCQHGHVRSDPLVHAEPAQHAPNPIENPDTSHVVSKSAEHVAVLWRVRSVGSLETSRGSTVAGILLPLQSD